MGEQDPSRDRDHGSARGRVGEVALLFLRLGTIAFGGPAAHIAMMRDELVRRRGWLSDRRFVDLMGATNLIPGPNSTELAITSGFRAGPVARPGRGGGVFHPAGRADGDRAGVGVCALR